MQVSRLVNFRRQHPRPFLHDFPDTDKEVRMLADWVVGMVDDLVDDSIEFIGEDEYVEVTPKSIRLRKKILQANQR